ncbi:monoamine oxidase [Bradyrhizobium barranii subsp. barranii]
MGQLEHIVIVGAGAAGLMAARELARAGRTVTILEARERCGGRIDPLPASEFGYPADGGAEFVHGEAPVTRKLVREAGLSLQEIAGTQWSFDGTRLSHEDRHDPHEAELYAALGALKDDLTVADFLRRHFADPEYVQLRHSIERMVEGYDAADPERASTLALREEWMDGGHHTQARIVGGYGALIDFLASECRGLGVTFCFGCAVSAIEETGGALAVRCAAADVHGCDRAILTVPLPLLREIALPEPARAKAAAADDIGFGSVIKILLRFARPWWRERSEDLADMTFLLSDQPIPVWWTRHPDQPVLTGWFGGPRTAELAKLDRQGLIDAAGRFACGHLRRVAPRHRAPSRDDCGDQLAARSVRPRRLFLGNAADARGPGDPRARRRPGAVLRRSAHRGRDMGTVEAALASGLETAEMILRG